MLQSCSYPSFDNQQSFSSSEVLRVIARHSAIKDSFEKMNDKKMVCVLVLYFFLLITAQVSNYLAVSLCWWPSVLFKWLSVCHCLSTCHHYFVLSLWWILQFDFATFNVFCQVYIYYKFYLCNIQAGFHGHFWHSANMTLYVRGVRWRVMCPWCNKNAFTWIITNIINIIINYSIFTIVTVVSFSTIAI